MYVTSNYQLVTITNLLMEQTKSNAGAFVDAAKLQIDGGIRNITNDLAMELYGSGTATRGRLAASGGWSYVNPDATMTLANPQQIVNFEVGQILVASSTDGGAPSTDTVTVTAVNRATGVITGTGSASSMDAKFANSCYLTVQGDLPSAGAGTTATNLGICGLAGWIPTTSPSSSENFWGVDRSTDPTRLAGLRYDASTYTIEEGITQALAFMNREGADPDYIFMDFVSYAALVNAMGAKVVNVQVHHDEVEVAFDGISFQSAYGKVTIIPDRNCPPQTAYALTMSTWKLRSLGRVPHILTYGMEGLEGLRVGTADALEIRIGYYANLICNAPGWNCVISLSA